MRDYTIDYTRDDTTDYTTYYTKDYTTFTFIYSAKNFSGSYMMLIPSQNTYVRTYFCLT